ncbi:RNase adapter RapZ [Desulfovirgula thermocuniculi]|uniref:RNase adapter RapZ n=1 Tax=Desulfovirgula thermocuniculi TaxID=348842 RepID=UPI0005510EB1|nr:RNase adapter RapZ [Desulfovirgula thermocuniculi]
MRLVIVTGLSGAGKTQALRILEDLGFFCVDNLPPTLIPKFLELCSQSSREINKIAVVVDIRGGEFFDALFEVLADLEQEGLRYEILFLETSDATLVRRYKESRRAHPLSVDGEILQSIQRERERLRELKGRAHKIIDTSEMTPQQLKEELTGLFGEQAVGAPLRVTVVSFGYKYGIPLDSDLVFDVRFLPNPHYDPALRPLTGNDPQVQEYVCQAPLGREFVGRFLDFIDYLIPHYVREGKATLTIAIGCTGGQHRSVVLANLLGEHLAAQGYRVAVRHRDISRK